MCRSGPLFAQRRFMPRCSPYSGRWPPSLLFGGSPFVVQVKRRDRAETHHQPEEARSMANYLLTFHGGSMPQSKEEQDQVMSAWTSWFGSLGDALVDGGNPVSKAKAISPDGSV